MVSVTRFFTDPHLCTEEFYIRDPVMRFLYENINICTILLLEKYHFEVGRGVRDAVVSVTK